MYQYSNGHSDFPAHLMFAFDACCGGLGTGVFGGSGLAAGNTLSWLPGKARCRCSLISIFQWFFLLGLAKLVFCRGDCALGYHSMVFSHFPDIS